MAIKIKFMNTKPSFGKDQHMLMKLTVQDAAHKTSFTYQNTCWNVITSASCSASCECDWVSDTGWYNSRLCTLFQTRLNLFNQQMEILLFTLWHRQIQLDTIVQYDHSRHSHIRWKSYVRKTRLHMSSSFILKYKNTKHEQCSFNI